MNLLNKKGLVIRHLPRHDEAVLRRCEAAGVATVSYTHLRGTIALWLTYFMGLFVIYLLNGWLPTILRSGGLSLQQAAMMLSLIHI